MNILVIGGTRFFGIHTVNSLLANGHTVTVATRGGHGNPFGDCVCHLTVDKTDETSVKTVLGGRQYDVVIDKVAYSSNDVRSLLKHINCKRYIQMSSSAVYQAAHPMICEEEFDMQKYPLRWIDRPEDYAEGKRQAERAALEFLDIGNCTFVRYPVVMGVHDYTERLRFYIRHILNGLPMRVENPDSKAPYIHENEAGEFLAFLTDHPVSGAVNGSSAGSISQQEINLFIEARSNKTAVISQDGDAAPYDGSNMDISLDCTKAAEIGFSFSALHSWIFDLLHRELTE